jgi:nitrogen fixation/metabolism regulation signal transduction histidine kinase
LQTLAENTILNSIVPAQKDGIIKLNMTKKNERLLLIQVIDNGIGLEAAKKLKAVEPQTHKSKGTNILIARVEALTHIHNLDCSNEFKVTVAGTAVNLFVPYSIYQDEKKNIIS